MRRSCSRIWSGRPSCGGRSGAGPGAVVPVLRDGGAGRAGWGRSRSSSAMRRWRPSGRRWPMRMTRNGRRLHAAAPGTGSSAWGSCSAACGASHRREHGRCSGRQPRQAAGSVTGDAVNVCARLDRRPPRGRIPASASGCCARARGAFEFAVAGDGAGQGQAGRGRLPQAGAVAHAVLKSRSCGCCRWQSRSGYPRADGGVHGPVRSTRARIDRVRGDGRGCTSRSTPQPSSRPPT